MMIASLKTNVSSEINGPQRQKTYIQTSAPSEDSDQTAQSSLGAFWKTRDAKFFHIDNEDYDQTTRMRSLI